MSQVKASEELVPQERLLSGDDCELFRGVWFRSFGLSTASFTGWESRTSRRFMDFRMVSPLFRGQNWQ